MLRSSSSSFFLRAPLHKNVSSPPMRAAATSSTSSSTTTTSFFPSSTGSSQPEEKRSSHHPPSFTCHLLPAWTEFRTRQLQRRASLKNQRRAERAVSQQQRAPRGGKVCARAGEASTRERFSAARGHV
ncbi:hypothetical protein FQA47_010946 [Oryzias melastigma]|uniref:Uncharacterized protein n=1 Tax=Oryzias melastigma TaxID=30732 RepID=A0A834C0W6_ORYME|nr:hypothetical protein FQA47_010946 [Oryzias melastigma]